MAGMLYLVPTPIGNLGDISLRCRETLESADFIAAEDTRVTLKLLNHLGIKKSLVSYYEHNKATKGDRIVDRILAGETCALVSDAGSPAISDPGEDLVKQCAEAGIIVCAIPGPCAAITALSISGQSTGRFCFEGFLSTAKKSRREHLDAAVTVRFYGSDGSDWREIFAEERSFQGHSHIHAYFHLPPACFAPENWGGETLEELAVWVGEAPPAPTEQGQLLFLEP